MQYIEELIARNLNKTLELTYRAIMPDAGACCHCQGRGVAMYGSDDDWNQDVCHCCLGSSRVGKAVS